MSGMQRRGALGRLLAALVGGMALGAWGRGPAVRDVRGGQAGSGDPAHPESRAAHPESRAARPGRHSVKRHAR